MTAALGERTRIVPELITLVDTTLRSAGEQCYLLYAVVSTG
jgi:hypothetical protein